MLKELEKKIDELSPGLLKRFQHHSGMDFTNTEYTRDIYNYREFISGFQRWRTLTKKNIEESEEKFGFLLSLYFKTDVFEFQEELFELFRPVMISGSPSDLSDLLNWLAEAITLRKIERQALSVLMAASPNQ